MEPTRQPTVTSSEQIIFQKKCRKMQHLSDYKENVFYALVYNVV
jgi:hypothetical protein